jgi:hypothetical protein
VWCGTLGKTSKLVREESKPVSAPHDKRLPSADVLHNHHGPRPTRYWFLGKAMSRRTEIIDEFDDDTDIPLPSRPLNTSGTRGAILEEIGVSSDEDKPRASRPSASSPPAFKQPQAVPPGVNMVTDRTPFKTCAPCALPFRTRLN